MLHSVFGLPRTGTAALALGSLLCVNGCAGGGDLSGTFTSTTTTTNMSTFTTSPDDDSGDGDATADDTGPGDGDGDTSADESSSGDGDGDGGTSGDGDGDGEVVCGDGVIEGSEVCDTGDIADETCETQGFGGGGLACAADCTFDTSNCTSCGNDTVDDAAEDCDGSDLGASATCADVGLGSASENLGCNEECSYDYTECSGCGDGSVNDPEQCEPPPMGGGSPDLNGGTCASLGFDGGELLCSDGCAYLTEDCFACGDAVLDAGEECDSADFGSASCADYNSPAGPAYDTGSLSCDDECTIDTANCSYCGDDIVSGAEACDGAEINGETCESLGLGYTGGTLGCNADCGGYDHGECTSCGDANIEGDEQCEGNNFDGNTCVSMGYPGGGDLNCVGCVIDTSACSGNFCGDGTVDAGESCDCGNQGETCTSAELGGETCMSQNFDGGTLKCSSPNNCSLDTSDCYQCGDGVVNPGEDCDSNLLNGGTCTNQGFPDGGPLACDNSTCTYDTGGCHECGNAVLDPGEACDGGNLNGATCTSEGYAGGGSLACNSSTCEYDYGGCDAGGGGSCSDPSNPTGPGTCPSQCTSCDTVNNVCNITCGLSDCDNTTINCPDNWDCSISCPNSSACDFSTLNCPNGGDCTISCVGTSACDGANINCGDGLCDVTCDGAWACETGTFSCGGSDSSITCLSWSTFNDPIAVNSGGSCGCTQTGCN